LGIAIRPVEMHHTAYTSARDYHLSADSSVSDELRDPISLDDSLYEWLPKYPYIDCTVTIRQLLNHTGGLYHFVDNDDFWQSIFSDPTRIWTPEEMILAFNRESVFPKGTGWHYSQTGYNLLRMIIMDITGSDIATVNRDRFWVPLGMSNTYTSMGEEPPVEIAHGWWDLDGDGSYDDFTSWSRAAFSSGIGGEVWTTAEDLAKWARALFHDKIVISQTSLDQMLTFQSPCTGEELIVAGYGLGALKYNPQIVNGLEGYGHSGNAPGYAAACVYLPAYDVCIGITDNTEAGDSMSSVTNIISVITNQLDETP